MNKREDIYELNEVRKTEELSEKEMNKRVEWKLSRSSKSLLIIDSQSHSKDVTLSTSASIAKDNLITHDHRTTICRQDILKL